MKQSTTTGQTELPEISPRKSSSFERRHFVWAPFIAAAASTQVSAAGLADHMKQRSSEALSKPLLPSIIVQSVKEIVFPDWLEGTWEARSQFVGYELPVKKLDKKTIMADKSIAGFQVGLQNMNHGTRGMCTCNHK